MPPITSTPTGVRITLQVQPRASETALAGRHGDALKVRVQSPPVDGAANDALIRFLSEALGVRRTAVRIVSGEGARRKTVIVEGITLVDAARRLNLEIGDPSG